MRYRVIGLGIVSLLVLLLVGTAQAHHDDDRPHTLLSNSWVCVSQTAYERAAAGKNAGTGVEALRQQLRNEEGQDLCIHVNDEILEDMLAPWVRIIEQQGEQVQVAFTVEYYQRLNVIHRRFSRVQFTGWTGTGNLDIYIQ